MSATAAANAWSPNSYFGTSVALQSEYYSQTISRIQAQWHNYEGGHFTLTARTIEIGHMTKWMSTLLYSSFCKLVVIWDRRNRNVT